MVVFLQFRLVVVVVRVVEMLGVGRAFLDASPALDANARDFSHIFRMDENNDLFFRIIYLLSIDNSNTFSQLAKKLDKIFILLYICKFIAEKVEQYSI